MRTKCSHCGFVHPGRERGWAGGCTPLSDGKPLDLSFYTGCRVDVDSPSEGAIIVASIQGGYPWALGQLRAERHAFVGGGLLVVVREGKS